jgi:hypothetical protein
MASINLRSRCMVTYPCSNRLWVTMAVAALLGGCAASEDASRPPVASAAVPDTTAAPVSAQTTGGATALPAATSPPAPPAASGTTTRTVPASAPTTAGPMSSCPVDKVRASGLTSALAVIRTMPPNSWAKVNLNTFSSVTSRTLPNCQGSVGPNAIINAWGGFAYDSNRSDLLTFGGGHADYCGNDVYRFRLSSLRWERAGASSQMAVWTLTDGFTKIAVPVDGFRNAPSVAHMYDQLTFLPVSDRMIYMGGYPFFSWGASPTYPGFVDGREGPWLFDPSRAASDKVVGTTGSGIDPSMVGGQMWSNRAYHANHPNQFYVDSNFGKAPAGSATVCESGRNVAYIRTPTASAVGSYLIKYSVVSIGDPVADQLVQVGAGSNHMSQGDLAVDTDKRIAVVMGDDPTRRFFIYWDLSTPGSTNPPRSVTSITDQTGGFAGNGQFGLDYDTARRRFLIWDGQSSVWELTLPSNTPSPLGWTVRRLIATGGPGAAVINHSGGANGKWKYAQDLDVFIALREAPNGDVWIYKPESWLDPAN